MFSICICDEEEYGSRLAGYLERKFADTTVFIRQFTDVEGIGDDDILIISEALYETMEGKPDHPGVIVIRRAPAEGEYSRIDPPSMLVSVISQRIGAVPRGGQACECEINVLFSPVFSGKLIHAALELAGQRYGESLVLGMEDLGPGGMEKLCYYIHIRERQIVSRIREISRAEDGCSIIDSPDWFYTFAELSEEDLQWFITRLKENGSYRNVYLMTGPASFGPVYRSGGIDQVFLCHSNGEKTVIRNCFSNMEKLLESDGVRYESLE